MKGYRKIMKAVAVILAFALIFSGMNVPGTALAATTAATAKNTVVKSITVSNLPAKDCQLSFHHITAKSWCG